MFMSIVADMMESPRLPVRTLDAASPVMSAGTEPAMRCARSKRSAIISVDCVGWMVFTSI